MQLSARTKKFRLKSTDFNPDKNTGKETSNNLAMVKIEGGQFSVKTLMRSSVDTAKAALAQKFEAIFALAGIETSFAGGYSGWAPNPDSAILATMKKV